MTSAVHLIISQNYMNSVERGNFGHSDTVHIAEVHHLVVHYSGGDIIDREAAHEIVDKKPPQEWPSRGAIDFKDIVMSYRPGLPIILNRISIQINGGERIGVVGRYVRATIQLQSSTQHLRRTGAGKSSLMLALLRIVELSSGSISIDG